MKTKKNSEAALYQELDHIQDKTLLSKEAMECFVKDYYALECRCFMCRRIVEKIEQGQTLNEGNQYHMGVCLLALKKLREERRG